MKYILFVIAVLSISACFLQPKGDVAELTISLQGAEGARVLGDEVDGLRLYLVNQNGAYYRFSDGRLYYQASEGETAAGTVTVEVPAGDWMVALELGEFVGEALLPRDYGISELTTIAPGVDNDVAINTEDSPFIWSEELIGSAFNGIVAFGTSGDRIYASTADKLYAGSSVTTLAEMSPAFNYSSYPVNSISKGTFFDTDPVKILEGPAQSELWVNTEEGIVPYRDGDFIYDFQNTRFSVLSSGGYFNPQVDAALPADIDPSDVTIFYKTESAFGGMNVAYDIDETSIPDYEDWTWNVNDNFDETFAGELVYEFFIHDGATYLATKLGTLKLDNDLVSTGGGDFLAEADEISISDEDGGEYDVIPIRGVSYVPDDGILLATDAGVFTATLTSTDSVISSLQLIGETEGKSFTTTAVSSDGSYAAAASATGVFLFKKAGSSFAAKDFPVYTGVPGGISSLTFIEDSGILVIAGEGGEESLSPDGGIAQIDVGALNW